MKEFCFPDYLVRYPWLQGVYAPWSNECRVRVVRHSLASLASIIVWHETETLYRGRLHRYGRTIEWVDLYPASDKQCELLVDLAAPETICGASIDLVVSMTEELLDIGSRKVFEILRPPPCMTWREASERIEKHLAHSMLDVDRLVWIPRPKKSLARLLHFPSKRPRHHAASS